MEITSRSEEGLIILGLAGRLDKTSSPQVREAIFSAVAQQPEQVILNMRGVYFIDSSGLSALVLGLRYASQNLVSLCLCELQAPVRMIFELTRFDKVFEIYLVEEDAVLADVKKHARL